MLSRDPTTVLGSGSGKNDDARIKVEDADALSESTPKPASQVLTKLNGTSSVLRAPNATEVACSDSRISKDSVSSLIDSDTRPRKRPSHLTDLRGSKKTKNIIPTSQTRREKDSQQTVASLPVIVGEDLRDPDWEEKNRATPSYATVVKALDAAHEANDAGRESVVALGEQQKKNQINWLALNARQNDALLLERSAAGKQKQRSTAMKYGW